MTHTPVERPGLLLKELASAYEGHLRQYERWLAMAEDGIKQLDAGQLDEFLTVHEQKQAVADDVQKEEASLRRQRDQVAAALGLTDLTLLALERAASSAADEGALRAAVDEWRRLLERLNVTMQQVAKAEKRIEGKLRDHLRALSASVADARQTRRAVRAYHAEGDDHDARFIDRKS